MKPQTAPIVITLKNRLGPQPATRHGDRSSEEEPAQDTRQDERNNAAGAGRGRSRSRSRRSRDNRSRSRSHRSRGSNRTCSPSAGSAAGGGLLNGISPKKRQSQNRIEKAASSGVDGIASGPGDRSHSPLPPVHVGRKLRSDMLGVDALEDIFGTFHNSLEQWLEIEGAKLKRAEVQGKETRNILEQCALPVCAIMRETAPSFDQGVDPSGEGFCVKVLPQFLDMLQEDQRAITGAVAAMRKLSEAHRLAQSPGGTANQGEEELSRLLKAETSPAAALRALLGVVASRIGGSANGVASRGGDRGERGSAGGRGRRGHSRTRHGRDRDGGAEGQRERRRGGGQIGDRRQRQPGGDDDSDHRPERRRRSGHR